MDGGAGVTGSGLERIKRPRVFMVKEMDKGVGLTNGFLGQGRGGRLFCGFG